MKKNKHKYDIKKACKILKISRSGFYEYLSRKPSSRFLENEVLITEIKTIFEEHKARYGCIRITKELQNRGIIVNRKRVSKLMAKGARKNYQNYAKKNNNQEKANLLNQIFHTDSLNKVWVGDITYIPTSEGTLYLAVFIDLFSRKVVGWSMNKRMKEELVIDAYLQAYGKAKPPKGLIVHTDQGSQYTGVAFRSIVENNGGNISNSGKGNPYDNAIMESFYKNIKKRAH